MLIIRQITVEVTLGKALNLKFSLGLFAMNNALKFYFNKEFSEHKICLLNTKYGKMGQE